MSSKPEVASFLKDFKEGPVKEELYRGADMWVFGKTIKKEKYISKSRWDQLAAVLSASLFIWHNTK
jgi:hypothetical protein